MLIRILGLEMDKLLKTVQLLTLILVSWVCLTYIWRQYYNYKRRQEAWETCYRWAYDEAKLLSKSETLVIQECMQRIKP
jgi:hypothetical protein